VIASEIRQTVIKNRAVLIKKGGLFNLSLSLINPKNTKDITVKSNTVKPPWGSSGILIN